MMHTIDPESPVRLTIAPDHTTRWAVAPAEGDLSFEPWVDALGRDYGYCYDDGDRYFVRIYGVGSFVFTRHSTEAHGTPEPDLSPDAFEQAFYREVVPFVLQRHTWEVLHASGLTVAGASIALCGDSEMGKSTLAYAWRRRCGCIYADDAIPFRLTGDGVAIWPIPFQVRLRRSSLRYFGPSDDDADSVMSGMLPTPSVDDRLLRAIYLLDRRKEGENAPIRIEALSPQAVLPALLRQAYCLTLRDRARNQQMVETYILLTNVVPVFCLTYPSGMHHVAVILDQLTEHVAAQIDAARCEPRTCG